jgi:hypothetical protein
VTMRLRPAYQIAVPPLYLLAACLAGVWLQSLPDRLWERVWWPVIIGSIASVYLPTTAWLARRSDPRWMPTTALNAAVAHAAAALLVYAFMIHDELRGPPYTDADGGIQFDIPRTLPGWDEIIAQGLVAALVAAALAAILAIPPGRPLPHRCLPRRALQPI